MNSQTRLPAKRDSGYCQKTSEIGCPFYGFYMRPSMNVMVDQSGNQCALITSSHSPCSMERRGMVVSGKIAMQTFLKLRLK